MSKYNCSENSVNDSEPGESHSKPNGNYSMPLERDSPQNGSYSMTIENHSKQIESRSMHIENDSEPVGSRSNPHESGSERNGSGFLTAEGHNGGKGGQLIIKNEGINNFAVTNNTAIILTIELYPFLFKQIYYITNSLGAIHPKDHTTVVAQRHLVPKTYP